MNFVVTRAMLEARIGVLQQMTGLELHLEHSGYGYPLSYVVDRNKGRIESLAFGTTARELYFIVKGMITLLDIMQSGDDVDTLPEEQEQEHKILRENK
jgi:hypothetical protein